MIILLFVCVCFVLKPVSALYSFPKIHTGSVVSGKSSISPNRSVSYVKVAVRGPNIPVSMFQIKDCITVIGVQQYPRLKINLSAGKNTKYSELH